MKAIVAAVLASAGVLSCARVAAVPVASPATEVSMTPVQRSADGMVVAHRNLMGWTAGPSSLPAGARMLVLEGDPTKAELFTMRLHLPDNYTIQPHHHPAWEHITVISGIFHLGMGDTFSSSAFTELRAGSFAAIPTGMRHFAHTVGETVIQLHGMGPWRITYVNAAHDPRNR